MSSKNKDFTLVFPIRMYFTTFSGLNLLTRTSSTILTATAQKLHFSPNLRWKAFSLSSLSRFFCRYPFYQVEEVPVYS